MHLVDQNNAGWRYEQYNDGDGTNFRNFRAKGTIAAPTAVTTDTRLGSFLAGGYGVTGGFSGVNGGMSIWAAETYAATAAGTYLTFGTAAIGANPGGGGTERMRIDSSGNVGIGTSSPSQKLDVRGAIYQQGSSAGVTYIQQSDGTNSAFWQLNPLNVSASFGAASGNAIPFIVGTNNTERMRIDASGRVTTPYQPAFIAAGLAAQTTYTASQVIVFNTAPLNIGSGYSTSTGRFTAPVAGTYAFTFQLYLNPGNGNAPIGFFKNGNMEIFFLQGVTQNGIGLSTIISMAANDYVEVRVRNIVGASATIFNGADHTQFTGYLIG
jgi:hypothetical protein